MSSSKGKFFFPYLAGLIVLFVGACDTNVSKQQKTPAVRPVKLVSIEATASHESRSYPAIIGTAQSSSLAFQVSGLVNELPVVEAQTIEAGAIIAKLDQRDFRNKAASARAQFENAEKEYQRTVQLAKKDLIARSVLDQNKSKRDIAQTQFALAQKALDDTVLKAPFDGLIAKVHVKRLENIQVGKPVVTILGKGKLEATINLPASVIANFSSRTNWKAHVVLAATPANRIQVAFKEASLEADAISQTYEVTFSFDAPQNLIILPGMNATVVLTWSEKKTRGERDNIAVPLHAVLSEGDQTYVWVVDSETMTVSKRPVLIKEGIGEHVVVTKGLSVGDTIAGAGAPYLADGMKVRPWKNR